jgi:G3E family GTPase
MQELMMLTDVYVVSGFLGTGKTTWIQKLLKDSFQGQKVVLIENDFGKESVDAALLRHQGVVVTEINSGCICCSLAGDFIKAVQEILHRFDPQVLLIEPSGVGKLSDVVKSCQDDSVKPLLHLAGKMTVVDAARHDLYMENFGEFYLDQILLADVLLLSHLPEMKEPVLKVRLTLEKINPHAIVFDAPWDNFSAGEVLKSLPKNPFAGDHCNCSHAHSEQDADVDHDCDRHDHNAEEIFETYALSSAHVFTKRELEACFQRISGLQGYILRAKGIMRGGKSNWLVQYVPGRAQITPTGAPAGIATFIGQDLDRAKILRIFQGEEQAGK